MSRERAEIYLPLLFWPPPHVKSIVGSGWFWRCWKNGYLWLKLILLSIRVPMKIVRNAIQKIVRNTMSEIKIFSFWKYSAFVHMIYSVANLTCKNMHWTSTQKLEYFMILKLMRNLLFLEWEYENVHRILWGNAHAILSNFKLRFKVILAWHEIGSRILEKLNIIICEFLPYLLWNGHKDP